MYLLLGVVYRNWTIYSVYYQRSLAAKILCPVSPLISNSPFKKNLPHIHPEFEKKYGIYAEYEKEEKNVFPFIVVLILWLPVTVGLYIFAVGTWVIWLLSPKTE